jgi:hypothetical protein
MRADLEGKVLTIAVPFDTIQLWRNGAELGLEARQTWPGGAVRILLEKDMQRLNPKDGEEAGDVYPNPLFGKKRCDHP